MSKRIQPKKKFNKVHKWCFQLGWYTSWQHRKAYEECLIAKEATLELILRHTEEYNQIYHEIAEKSG
jgi:hypothetical protein